MRRTAMPGSAGKSAATLPPSPIKRMPRNAKDCSESNVIPKRRKAWCESGIRPSPQALSMGGCAESATVTSNPLRRAAIAAANPAGPPPTMKTSVKLPPQQDKLGTKAGTHGSQDAVGPWRRAALHHHFFEHQQH